MKSAPGGRWRRRNAISLGFGAGTAFNKEVLQRGLLRPGVGLAGDQPIQGGLPADDAVGQFLAEVAVGGRESRFGERGFEAVLDEVSAWGTLQEAQCNFSWFWGAHGV